MNGRVIGINAQILSRSGGNAGVGFAIPIDIAKQVVPTLIEGETYQYPWLGITGATLSPEVADFMRLPEDTRGVLVINVTQDGPADEVELQGSDKTLTVEGEEFQLGGDVITAIDGQPVESMDELITYLVEETRPGDEVTLDLIRPDGTEETETITLQTRPGREALTQSEQEE
jgi:S1-C subfamily serine protease